MSDKHTGFNVPSDLSDTSGAQAIGATRSPGARRSTSSQFLQRVEEPSEVHAGARPVSTAAQALTEHRQPPDSQFLTTGLPSGCALYEGFTSNSIGVRRFNSEDVLKIYDARAEQSLRMLAEALGATLHGFNVWDLTVGDFWFLMYWHRIHSYPKSPFLVSWTCTGEQHLQNIKDNKVSVESLHQEMILKSSDLKSVDLNAEAVRVFMEKIRVEYGVTATLMRMGDYVRIVEMSEENDEARRVAAQRGETKVTVPWKASDFKRARHAASLAQVHGASLDARMKALQTLADFDLWPQLDRLAEIGDHGVSEVYHVRCAHCNTRAEVEVALDALTFLPEL